MQFSVSSLRLLLLATLCKNEEDGVASDEVIMEELGGGVSKQKFQNDPSPQFYNKQAIKMEMGK